MQTQDLDHDELFWDLVRIDVDTLDALAQRARYHRDEVVEGPRREEGGLFAVERGEVRIYLVSSSDGRELTVGYRSTGHVFELGGFEKPGAGQTIAVATATPTVVYSVPWATFLEAATPHAAGALARSLRRSLHRERELLQEVAFSTVKVRLAHKLATLVECQAGSCVTHTRADLAAMIGTREEEVIKALREFRIRGLVQYRPYGRDILIVDPAQLAALS